MILTVTLNPAIDKIVLLNGYQLHALHRLSKEESSLTLPGGKGVNISIGLNALGNSIVATGFAAGNTGHLLTDSLRQKGITTNFIFTEGATRTNISILDLKNETLTAVNEEGPNIDDEDQSFFMEAYRRNLLRSSLVVVGGSLPKGMKPEFYAKMIYYANKANVPIIIHVAPRYFDAVLSEKPMALIPDLRSKHVLRGKPANVILALREIGAEMITENRSLQYVIFENRIEHVVAVTRKKSYVLIPSKLQIVNMLGYADAYVAGFAHGLIRRYAQIELLLFASACGLTNVEQVSKDLENIAFVKKNLERIQLEEIA